MRGEKLVSRSCAGVCAVAAGLALVTFSARAQQGQGAGSQAAQASTNANPQTRTFIQQAARNNDMEVALAEVGVRKAQSPELKTLSQQVQQDHIQANNQLRPIAQEYGVTVDQPLTRHDRHELSKLEKASGSDFDQRLAIDFLRQHQQGIAQYERAAQESLPADVKQYAQDTLPELQQHLQHAETVAKDIGVSSATISAIVNRTPEAVGGTGAAQEPEQTVGGSQKTEKGAGAKQLEQPGFPQERP